LFNELVIISCNSLPLEVNPEDKDDDQYDEDGDWNKDGQHHSGIFGTTAV